MQTILKIEQVSKVYPDGLKALDCINMDIRHGEILALLGPNGAGKTTLINVICGIVRMTEGKITVKGLDTVKDYRQSRSLIGLVPQELYTDAFETVYDTVSFSRELFGRKRDHNRIQNILKDLSLWDKRHQKIITLSGGMKRRVMIAKALSHEPEILFLDEPTAGVDVELRKEMWAQVKELKARGVTIILTTHYIEEAETIADRIAVINKGNIIITETTQQLMKKLGKKKLLIDLVSPLTDIPAEINSWPLTLSHDGLQLAYSYDSTKDNNGISKLLALLNQSNIDYTDVHTHQTSLEDIFIELVKSA